MRVIDIARRANVSPETERYYARLVLLTPARDPGSSYKIFDECDYVRLRFIRDARSLGMSIVDVQAALEASRDTRASHPQIASLFRKRLDAVKKEIKTLTSVERHLASLLQSWERSPRRAPTGRGIARVIEAWPERAKR